jgi:nucleotide-binding universal stress UspA family protein
MSHSSPCRVLVAPPGDAASARAVVVFAVELANRLGAELILVAIAPLAVPSTAGEGLSAIGDRGAGGDRAQERLDRAARAHLEALLSDVPAHVAARIVLARGRPGPTIVAAAREQEADMIVVGMRRMGRAAHVLHDGPDRYVLHHSAVPVVAVPYETTQHRGRLPSAA